jgi:hypothetical protein
VLQPPLMSRGISVSFPGPFPRLSSAVQCYRRAAN